MSIKLIVVLLCNLVGVSLAYLPTVKIKQGTLEGGIGKTVNARTYYYFTGIPYAKPPIGWHRFEPPAAPKPWNGTLDATQSHPICMQFESKRNRDYVIGEEDCLYLNVYVPQLEFEQKLVPVIFYIEGDGFEYSNPNREKYGPDLLLDRDVILVTVSYRLGALGFFISEDGSISGNMGLKDQAFALKWVKKNIIEFGGNPEKITVVGHEAGAASAHYHMLSPLSRDLISGVIAESGTAFNSWALAPIQVIGIRSRVLAGVLNCPTNTDIEEMVKCLKTLKGADIIKQVATISEKDNFQIFKPVIELHSKNAFLPQDPLFIMRSGEVADVPVMLGIAAESGALDAAQLLNSPDDLKEWNENFEDKASKILHYGESAIVRERPIIGKKIKNYYFKGADVNEASRKELTNMFTDGLYLEGIRSSSDLHMKYSKKPMYHYLFGYRGSESYTNTIESETDYGVSSKDDLLYLFKNDVDFPLYEPNKSDKEVSNMLVKLWTNFAIYGDPTPTTDSKTTVKWSPIEINKENYYYIKTGTNVELKQDMFAKRAKFWKTLILDSRRKTIRDEL